MCYKYRLLTTADEFNRLEDIWNKLLLQSPSDNYFLRWEWLWNWWHVFAEKDDKLAIIVLEKNNEVTGIGPFYIRRRLLGNLFPVKRLMFLGTQDKGDGDVGSDYMNIIYKNGEADSTIKHILEAIVKKDLCDEIYLSKMDTSSEVFNAVKEEAAKFNLRIKVYNTFISPYINLPMHWDDYLSTLSSSMRYKIRREAKRVKSDNNLSFKRVERPDEFENYFKELIRLHQMRWQSKGIDGVFSSSKFTSFHKRVAPVMLKNGHLEFVCLTEKNINRAIIYNVVYNNKIYFYQSGIDAPDSNTAFGYLLHCYCIEEAIKKGMKEYDFLPSGRTDDYKARFTKTYRMVSDIYMARHFIVKVHEKVKDSLRPFIAGFNKTRCHEFRSTAN